MSSIVIPSDAPSIYGQLTKLDQAAIVRPNNPPAGLSGFLFSIDLDQVMKIGSVITDRVIEDNTTISDNIVLLPEIVTVRGLIAELVSKPPTQAKPPAPQPAPLPLFPGLFPSYPIGAALAKLGPIGPSSAPGIIQAATTELLGGANLNSLVSSAVTGTINTAVTAATGAVSGAVENAIGNLAGGSKASPSRIIGSISQAAASVLGNNFTPALADAVGRAVNSSLKNLGLSGASPLAASSPTLSSFFGNKADTSAKGTAQARAMGFFYQMWLGRQLFSVETPWGVMENMALLSGDFEQPEETVSSSMFTITFKKIRFVTPAATSSGQLAGRSVFQQAAGSPSDKGTAGQTPTTPAQEESWLYQLTKGGGG